MFSPTVRVHAALLLVSLIYGYFYVTVKLLFKTITPAELILLRFLLTAIIVTGIDQFILKNPPPKRQDLLAISKLGLLGVFVVQILVAAGVNLTTASHSALIMATIPIFTLLISLLKKQEAFQPQKLAGVITAFIGVVILLMFSGSPNAPLPQYYMVGDLIVLLNAFAFAWFLVGSREILSRYNSFSFMAYCYIISAGLFSICYLGGEQILYHQFGLGFLQHISWQAWLLILYVVGFASIGSYTLNNFALKRTSPTVVAIYIFLQPMISAATGYYVLGEHFTVGMAIAGSLTFIGLLLTTMKSPVQAPPISQSELEPEMLCSQEKDA